MKLYLSYIIVFLYFINTFSQQTKIDSLKVELSKTKIETKKLTILEALTTILINGATPSESLAFFNEFAKISKELNDKEKESRAYKYISECYIKLEDFEKAEKYAKYALNISSKSDDTNFYLIDINHLGRVYNHFQKYDLAIETYNLGIKKYKKKPEGSAIATVYANLGISYGNIEDTNMMIQSYIKGVEFADKLKNYNAKSSTLYNIGYTYMNLEQYEKAEKYFLDGLKDSSKVTLDIYKNIHFHALGLNYSRWGKYEKSLKFNLKALTLYRKTGNQLYEFDVLNNIAELYRK